MSDYSYNVVQRRSSGLWRRKAKGTLKKIFGDELAKEIMSHCSSFADLYELSQSDDTTIFGLDKGNTSKLKAIFSLDRLLDKERRLDIDQPGLNTRDSSLGHEFRREWLSTTGHDEVRIRLYDCSNEYLMSVAFTENLHELASAPVTLFRPAVERHVPFIVIGQHVAGSLGQPSEKEIQAAKRLVAVGAILNIHVRDFVRVSIEHDQPFQSMRQYFDFEAIHKKQRNTYELG